MAAPQGAGIPPDFYEDVRRLRESSEQLVNAVNQLNNGIAQLNNGVNHLNHSSDRILRLTWILSAWASATIIATLGLVGEPIIESAQNILTLIDYEYILFGIVAFVIVAILIFGRHDILRH